MVACDGVGATGTGNELSKRRELMASLGWSNARTDDAASMAALYNNWVAHGARVPGVKPTTEHRVRIMVADLQGRGYPVWCFWSNHVLVGWCSLGPFGWGGSGTLGTIDFSIYVLPNWVGVGIGAQAVFLAYRQRHVLGFRSLVVWILRGNGPSRNLAHGIGLQHWGTVPQLVEGNMVRYDVDIWGCHLDDPAWCAYMDRLSVRLERRFGGWMRERRNPVLTSVSV